MDDIDIYAINGVFISVFVSVCILNRLVKISISQDPFHVGYKLCEIK